MLTNNTAELSASIAALWAVPAAQPLLVVTHSKYVFDGVTTHLQRWLLLGRQVPNWDLWAQLQEVVHSCTAPTHWKHVYSHVGILGNGRADSLVNQGRLNHLGRAQYLSCRRARDSALSSSRGDLFSASRLSYPFFLLHSSCTHFSDSFSSMVGWLAAAMGPAGKACETMPALASY